jgi:hypothetical protein
MQATAPTLAPAAVHDTVIFALIEQERQRQTHGLEPLKITFPTK